MICIKTQSFLRLTIYGITKDGINTEFTKKSTCKNLLSSNNDYFNKIVLNEEGELYPLTVKYDASYLTVNLFINFIWCLLVTEGRKTTRNVYRYFFFYKKNLASWEKFLFQYKLSISKVMKMLFSLLINTFPRQFLLYDAYTVAYDSSLMAKNEAMKKIPLGHPFISYALPRYLSIFHI